MSDTPSYLQQGLQIVNSLSQADVSNLAAQAVTALLTSTKVPESLSSFGLAGSQATTTIFHFILNSSRLNLSADDAALTLRSSGVTSPQICQTLISVYEQNKSQIRSQVLKDATLLPRGRIVDCVWRMHHVPTGDHLDKANEDGLPSYLISFKISTETGSITSIDFECNVVELTDLLAKVKDANRQFARFSGESR
eukprot:TRINITY_DN15183_c0_g1_i1.p1 TRINITY_DN15183_c0_g1~~TRINITY_DN15183_c0_g1_i1.p1  ORF type:complete len:195 (+),score=31.53 TRINITY_DN15183_c0_g1_i1:95-679(+)